MRLTLLAALAVFAAVAVPYLIPYITAAQSVQLPSTEVPNKRWGANYFPNLPMVNQDGKTFRFYDDLIKNKIVVLSFIYTSCRDICPLTTARMQQVEEKLGDIVGRDIFIYSITVDPKNDTPEKLKEYANAYSPGPGWMFLTGKEEDIRLITGKFGDRSTNDNLYDHKLEISLGNDATGEWQRDSAFGDLDRLIFTIRSMDPKFRNELPVQASNSAGDVGYAMDTRPGQVLFKKLCAPCHTVGVGDRAGPDLRGVTSRRDNAWLTSFILDPDKVFAQKDPAALELLATFKGFRMPRLGLNDVDVEDLISFLNSETARLDAINDLMPTAADAGPVLDHSAHNHDAHSHDAPSSPAPSPVAHSHEEHKH
jgi:cytochrome oxidase Cu insertion factor (SCO1/SenC/PrrC family)/cytochrome c2